MEIRATITYNLDPEDPRVDGLLDALIRRLAGYGPVLSGNLAESRTDVTIAYEADDLGGSLEPQLREIAASMVEAGIVGAAGPLRIEAVPVDQVEPATAA